MAKFGFTVKLGNRNLDKQDLVERIVRNYFGRVDVAIKNQSGLTMYCVFNRKHHGDSAACTLSMNHLKASYTQKI